MPLVRTPHRFADLRTGAAELAEGALRRCRSSPLWIRWTARAGPGSADLHDGFDLYGDVERQLRHPDRGPSADASILEDISQQLRAAVDHLRGPVEARRAVDHVEKLHHSSYPSQVTELGVQRSQDLQPGEPRRRLGGVQVEVAAHLT